MNRFNNSSDPSMATGYRVAAIARGIAAGLVIGGIFLAGVHQPSSSPVPEAGTDQSAPPAADTSLDSQLRLDPSEIMFYSSNVHG